MRESVSHSSSRSVPRLLKSVGWMFVGTMTYSLTWWLTFVIVGRVLGPAGLGEYALVISVVLPVFEFFSFQLNHVLGTDIDRRRAFSVYELSTFGSCICAMGVVAVLAAVFLPQSLFWLALVFALFRFAHTLSELRKGLFQRESDLRPFGLARAAVGLIELSVFATALAWSEQVVIAVVAMTVARFLTLYFVEARAGRHLLQAEPRVPFAEARRQSVDLIRVSAMLAPTAFFAALTWNMPRYFTGLGFGAEEVGYIAAFFQFVTAVAIVARVFALNFATWICRQLAADHDWPTLRRRLLLTLLLLFIAGVVGVGFAWAIRVPLIAWTFGPEFLGQERLFLAAFAAIPFLIVTLTLNQICVGLRRYRLFLIATICSLITSVVVAIVGLQMHSAVVITLVFAIALCVELLVQIVGLWHTGDHDLVEQSDSGMGPGQVLAGTTNNSQTEEIK